LESFCDFGLTVIQEGRDDAEVDDGPLTVYTFGWDIAVVRQG
jgi:hypothetical protein